MSRDDDVSAVLILVPSFYGNSKREFAQRSMISRQNGKGASRYEGASNLIVKMRRVEVQDKKKRKKTDGYRSVGRNVISANWFLLSR